MTLADQSTSSGIVYGAIANPGVRKRERKGGVPQPAPTVPAVKAEVKSQTKQEVKPLAKEEPRVEKMVPAKETKAPPVGAAAKKGAAAPNLKRQGSSGISQMFAKASAKPKKPTSTTNSKTSSVADTPSPALSDDGEDDSEMLDVKPDPAASKARKSRQDDLRRMMEESDDDTESKAESPAEESVEGEPVAETEPKAEEGPAEEVTSTSDGRKRGRRRITKKVTKMDDQGYLSEFTTRVLLLRMSNHKAQSPVKNRLGSHSRRTKLRQQPSRRSRRPRNQRLLQRERKGLQRARATSCRSFPRNRGCRMDITSSDSVHVRL